MRVLAIQLKRIGDLVLTTPALHALKTALPGAHLTLAVTETTAALLPAMSRYVDDSLVYRSGQPGNAMLWRRLAAGGFDLCVDFTGRDRSALMTLAARAPRRVIARSTLRKGFWRRFCYNRFVEPSVRGRHTIDFYLDHAAVASGQAFPELPASPASPLLDLPADAVERGRSALANAGVASGEPFVVIHPGTARAEKYWLPERWAEVIDYCQGTLGLPCVLTGGAGDPCEQEHLARIRACLRAPCADLAGRLDLLTLAAVLAEAEIFASVDSGPMHLASAACRPQVALFGPTNPFHWRPRHPRCLVLQAGNGDGPVSEFRERSPRASLDAISTGAVISCINDLRRAPQRGVD